MSHNKDIVTALYQLRERCRNGTGLDPCCAFDTLRNTAEEFVFILQLNDRLVTASAEKVYDGEALTAHAYELIGALASGDTVESVTVEGSQTRVGRSENLITDVVIRNAEGEDVTRNYAIETVAGYLRVNAP